MLSTTSEHALKAMVYLAQHADEWPIPGRQVAAELAIPRKYLSSILRDLVRAGVLESSPGPGGGFKMVRSADTVRLCEVLAPFEPGLSSEQGCPFGNATCSDDDPCAGHERWRQVKDVFVRFLEETTVRDVAFKRARRGGSQRRR